VTEIKICGLAEPRTLALAVALGASHIGFVFFPRSPRNLALAAAPLLTAELPAGVRRVGVFVDPDDELLEAAIAAAGLDVIQLHGAETPERIGAVRRRFGLETWKAVQVATAEDIAAAAAYASVADRLLFDAKPPRGADLPGGNGVAFDWRLLEGPERSYPWGLSGGLDPESVRDALRTTNAPLVDVSSGVEERPGVKSQDKIRRFIEAVRGI
jgi:phosphoribosylanthranilate isomerase